MINNANIQRTLYIALILVLVVFFLSQWMASIPVFYNDDTCVYFNYARNITVGNWFAYDSRGIPSEGFTSLLFLFLLVPFELFGVNLMFAAVLINILAVILIVITASFLMHRALMLSPASTGLFAVLLLCILTFDPNIGVMVGRALETLLGPAVSLVALTFLVAASYPQAYAPDTHKGHWFIVGFLGFSFLSYLTRPESIVALALCGVFLLVVHPRRGILMIYTAGFAIILLLYHIAKWQIFGDFFPTGFHRKVSSDEMLLSGINYVGTFIKAYTIPLVLCMLLLGVLWFSVQMKAARNRAVIPVCIMGITPLLIFLFSTPLVGYNHRYLINSIVVMYILLAFITVYILDILIERGLKSTSLWPFVSLLVVSTMGAGAFVSQNGIQYNINIYTKATQGYQEHLYIQFGKYLYERVHDSETATLAFGDAGCIPYSSHLTFIDTNGLTEPYIARLFQVDDLDTKTELFSSYVLSWEPDLVVLGYGNTSDNVWEISPNRHSPFGDESRLGVFAAYRQEGFEYICSINSYNDLHLGVSQDSPRFSDVAPVVLEYCDQYGYVLDNGLIARDGTGSVYFPRVILESDSS